MTAPLAIFSSTVPRARLDWAIETGTDHLKPIWHAVRDFGCGYLLVTQNAGPFAVPPPERPAIITFGDDTDVALGPAAFHRRSLRRLLVLVACAAIPEAYASAAGVAAFERRHTVIIETRPEHEIPWLDLVLRIRPGGRLLVCSVRGGTA